MNSDSPQRAEIDTALRPDDELWDERQAANCLGVGLRLLRSWRRRGEGPPHLMIGQEPAYIRRLVVQHGKVHPDDTKE